MIINLPEEILEYLLSYIYDTDRWSVSKTSIYFYQLMKNRLIHNWMMNGFCKIARSNLDKLSIKYQNILVGEYVFYYMYDGVYCSRHEGDEHDSLFIRIDKRKLFSTARHSFEKAIVEDEDGNIIRGLVDYEVIRS